MPTALVTGVTGQDGSYLAEQLLASGYEVHGLIRRSSSFNTERIEHLYVDPHEVGARLLLHYGDLTDSGSVRNLLAQVRPDEIYHMGAQSHVRVSFDMPEYTVQTIVLGTTNLLEAVHQIALPARVYHAASSEMFGDVAEPVQDEHTPFRPRSPYAAAKVGAYSMARVYREAYGMFVTNGILFNHESPRRSPTFVTRKITRGVARILAGLDTHLYLGNLDARRDWGYAPEYMEAVQRMLRHDEPDDFVIATGETHSVREFLDEVCAIAGLDPEACVRFDRAYLRPAEVNLLQGDASKAARVLEWKPTTTFHALVRLMLEADVRQVGLDPSVVLRPTADAAS
jgi:GDPmannose 4,6-dehydratase